MAANSPESKRQEAYRVVNELTAAAHKAEDFKVDEHVYVWRGTYEGSTTGVVSEVRTDDQVVVVVFEDGQSPNALQPVPLIPYELMHLGELQG